MTTQKRIVTFQKLIDDEMIYGNDYQSHNNGETLSRFFIPSNWEGKRPKDFPGVTFWRQIGMQKVID